MRLPLPTVTRLHKRCNPRPALLKRTLHNWLLSFARMKLPLPVVLKVQAFCHIQQLLLDCALSLLFARTRLHLLAVLRLQTS